MINENTDNYVTIDINKENSSCRINKVTDIKFGIIEIYQFISLVLGYHI